MRNNKKIIVWLIGTLLILLGIIICLGWILRNPTMVMILPGLLVMPFNAGLSILLCGIGLIVTTEQSKTAEKIQITIGLFLTLLSSIILSQYLFNFNLGIDQLFVKAWMRDVNPYPGRLVPNGAISFGLAGIVLFLLPFSDKKWNAYVVQAFAFIILFLGCLGLAGYAIKLDLIYPWYHFMRMATPAAIGIILLSIGLWIVIWDRPWFQELYEGHEDKKIMVISVIILFVISFAAGLAGFASLAYKQEMLAKSNLLETIHFDVETLNQIIEKQFLMTKLLQENKTIQNSLLEPTINNINALDKETAEIAKEFHHVEITTIQGQKIFNSGKQPKKPFTFTKKTFGNKYELIYDNQWLLHLKREIYNDGKQVGYIITEMNLPISSIFSSNIFSRRISVALICSLENIEKTRCMETVVKRNNQIFYQGALTSLTNYPTIKEKINIIIERSANNKLYFTAYAPIPKLGVALIFKKDASEIFVIMRKVLPIVIPAIFCAIILGALMLTWQVLPLVRRLYISESRYLIATQGSTDGLWDLDLKTMQVYSSPRYKAMLGYEENEIGNSIEAYNQLIHPEDRERVWKRVQAHIKKQIPYNIEFRMHQQDGSYHWYQSRGQAIWDKSGKALRMCGFITDISKRKEVDRLKDEFISTVSHELRTPLTSIRGSLELLQTSFVEDLSEKAKTLLDIAHRNCERLILLINDLLDVEKIESDQIRFTLQWFNLKDVIQNAIELNRPFYGKHQIRVIYKNKIDVQVKVDPERLLQVINNLLSNAIKFSKPGDEIEINVIEQENAVMVEIIDQGPGIPEDFQSKIFSKFAQADSSTTKKVAGTGLGLSISKAIIERFGGKIGFRSSPKGAVFYFELPKIPAHELSQAFDTKKKILICDDEQDVAHLLKNIIEKAGYDSDIAYTSKQAKELLLDNNYVALTLDLLLPDSDGIDLIQEIRKNSKTKNLPIIVVSVKAEEGKSEIKGTAMGILDWITKPIDEMRLLNSIKQINTLDHRPVVLYVEDDKDIVQMVTLHLSTFATVHSVTTLAAANKYLDNNKIDLVLLDVILPDGSGLELLDRLSNEAIPVVILSAKEVSKEISKQVANALVKSINSEQTIITAIKKVLGK